MTRTIALLGKHPAFGDFVSAGLAPDLRDTLQTWMTRVYAGAAAQQGEDWQARFDAAPPVRLWIGPAVLGICLQGVIIPSRDKVGRRFPLLAVTEDAGFMPPTLAPDQAVHDVLERHLQHVIDANDLSGLADLAQGATLEANPDIMPENTLWAVNPAEGPADLLQAVGSADYTRAAAQRSYWWCAPDGIRSAMVWSCTGLAGADAMLWLMSGVARGGAEKQDDARAAQD